MCGFLNRPKQRSGEVAAVDVKRLEIDKLAYAIAMAETKNCTLGYGEMYNNCFGIKSGNTAPCKNVGQNRMCIYDHPEESYTAFRKIWQTWYKGFPTTEMASRWTGSDRPDSWLRNVRYYYNNVG